MSLAELQSWLKDEGIRDDLNSITRLTVREEIANLIPEEEESQIDWPRLLLAGSILARSEERTDQEVALRIATAALTLENRKTVKDAGAVLMEKLSNFRSVALATERDLIAADLDERLGVSSRLESERREIENSVLVESSGHWLAVNDFQRRFWDSASAHQWLSASAPTASGKTFLVSQWLLDQMRTDAADVAIYLAPTRALVSEIENNLGSLLRDEDSIEVSSLPLKDKINAAHERGQRVILVFTQERLHLLLCHADRVRLIDRHTVLHRTNAACRANLQVCHPTQRRSGQTSRQATRHSQRARVGVPNSYPAKNRCSLT